MMKKLFALAPLFVAGTSPMAAPILVKFEGTWWAQANTDIGGRQQVPLSVPSTFSIDMVIDPDVNSFETFVVNANYMTRFPAVTVRSPITAYGLENPYYTPYTAASFASVSRYTASYLPYKIESQHFGYREISGTTYSDGGGGEWELKLWIDSPNLSVTLIRPINGSDLMQSFQSALTDHRQFNIYYEKSAWVSTTSQVTGYPYSGYIGGMSLNGAAAVVSVSAVPEASTALQSALGLMAITLATIRRRRAS